MFEHFRMRLRCGAGCSSGSVVEEGCMPPGGNPNNEQPQQPSAPPAVGLNPVDGSHLTLNTRGSLVSTASSASKPSTALASLAGLISDNNSAKEPLNQKVLVSHSISKIVVTNTTQIEAAYFSGVGLVVSFLDVNESCFSFPFFFHFFTMKLTKCHCFKFHKLFNLLARKQIDTT